MTLIYLTMCCSADSGGRPKIPRLNASPSSCPPNITVHPDVPSSIGIVTVIISYTTITIAFLRHIYYLPHFLGTYCPIWSIYHPLKSGLSKNGSPPGLSCMLSCCTAHAKAVMDAADHVRCHHYGNVYQKNVEQRSSYEGEEARVFEPIYIVNPSGTHFPGGN